MSFCPKCDRGSGNGGSVCRRCEEAEHREEQRHEKAKREFRIPAIAAHYGTCVVCDKVGFVKPLAGESMCEECFIREWEED